MSYIDCEYNALGRDKASVIVSNKDARIIGVLTGPFEPSGSILNVYSGTVRVTITGCNKNKTEYAAFQESIEKTFSEVIYLHEYPRSVLDIKIFVLKAGTNVWAILLNTISILLMNAGIQMKGVFLSVYHSTHKITTGYVYVEKRYQKLLQLGEYMEDYCPTEELNDLLERMVYSLKKDYKKDWLLI